MSTPSVDAAAVQALVSEVLRRILAAQPAAPGTAPAVSREHTIADRVITLAHLDRVPGGIREVAIAEKSVITPSARDRAKELGLTFVRHAVGGSAASPDHPFVIAQAACRGDASSRGAAIARAIPQSQQLPASGLVDVQSHTLWHPNFNVERRRLAPPAYERFVQDQLIKSKGILEQRLGGRVDLLAWPFGLYDQQLMQWASAAGYVTAFSIERRAVTRAENLMALPRYIVTDADRGARFGALLSGPTEQPASNAKAVPK